MQREICSRASEVARLLTFTEQSNVPGSSDMASSLLGLFSIEKSSRFLPTDPPKTLLARIQVIRDCLYDLRSDLQQAAETLNRHI